MADDPYASIATADPYASIATPDPTANPSGQTMPAGGFGSPNPPSDASLYWRALTNPVGEGVQSAKSPLGAFEQIGGQAIKSAAAIPNAILHPLDTLHSISPWVQDEDIGQKVQPFVDAAKGLVNGNPLPAENIAGQTLGAIEGGRMGAAAAGKAMPVISKVAPSIRPVSSPSIVSPAETAARDLTNAVNPQPSRAPGYIKAAQVEAPNIIDYAKRTNNPLNTRLEWAKAAEGNATEARSHYTENILGPHENVQVPAPQGSGVKSIPSGENPANRATTLGNVDDRIVQINKELSKPHVALNEADSRAALANEAALQAEHGQLTGLLHRSLADLTGIPEEKIADLRQRVGRSREIANDTNAAVTAQGLRQNAPSGQSGLSIPKGLGDVAVQGAQAVRGGPGAIADRAFQRAIKNFPGQSTPLPQVTAPRPQVTPASTVANTASAGTRLERMAEQKGTVHPAPTGAKAGDVKYANGKAFAFNPETGWWHPQ